MTEPGTSSTGIEVDWISTEGWDDDEAHIVLTGPSDHLKFEYRITGLERSKEYSIDLVFTPDLNCTYPRIAESEKLSRIEKGLPPKIFAPQNYSAKKHTDPQTIRTEWAKGDQWMAGRVAFDKVKFKSFVYKFHQGVRPNELFLGSGWQYKVAMRIRKKDVEVTNVYEKDVENQKFIACQKLRRRHTEGKRKSRGEERGDRTRRSLDGALGTSQARTRQATPARPDVFLPDCVQHFPPVEEQRDPIANQPSTSRQVPPEEIAQPGSSHAEDPLGSSSSRSAFGKRTSGGEGRGDRMRRRLEGGPGTSQASTSRATPARQDPIGFSQPSEFRPFVPIPVHPEANRPSTSQQARLAGEGQQSMESPPRSAFRAVVPRQGIPVNPEVNQPSSSRQVPPQEAAQPEFPSSHSAFHRPPRRS